VSAALTRLQVGNGTGHLWQEDHTPDPCRGVNLRLAYAPLHHVALEIPASTVRTRLSCALQTLRGPTGCNAERCPRQDASPDRTEWQIEATLSGLFTVKLSTDIAVPQPTCLPAHLPTHGLHTRFHPPPFQLLRTLGKK
jgi:hypothetical protein